MRLAKKGEKVRCDYMSPGWSVTSLQGVVGFFNINPSTGSNYLFIPEDRDRKGAWTRL